MLNRNTPFKKRSQSAYNNKIKKITDWYNYLITEKEKEIINPNTKQEPKRRELKPLQYYIDKIRKPQGENK